MNDENNKKETLSEKLIKERKLLAFGNIDGEAAEKLIAAMLLMESVSAEEPIKIYINSTGGSETDILAVFDVMRGLRCPVETVCTGKAHGFSALLLAGGAKGFRKGYANSEVMLAQVSRGRTYGQASDIELEVSHLLECKNRMNTLLAELCGKDAKTIQADIDRKHWMFADQAKEYGLIDEIIC